MAAQLELNDWTGANSRFQAERVEHLFVTHSVMPIVPSWLRLSNEKICFPMLDVSRRFRARKFLRKLPRSLREKKFLRDFSREPNS